MSGVSPLEGLEPVPTVDQLGIYDAMSLLRAYTWLATKNVVFVQSSFVVDVTGSL